ncbi:MAG: hypothetical protein H7141_05925 [Burkholderiales bacterium]|nr:hypothetical protein [Bacteroidia bacterium]
MTHRIPYRLIVSIIAGIAATMFLTMLTHVILNLLGQHPLLFKPMLDDNQVQFTLFYHSIYAIIGAMVTAKIAKNQSRKAVLILGTKELFMWVVGAFILYDHSPTWYNITKALLGVPLAWIGGRLYEHYKKRRSLVQAKRFATT